MKVSFCAINFTTILVPTKAIRWQTTNWITCDPFAIVRFCWHRKSVDNDWNIHIMMWIHIMMLVLFSKFFFLYKLQFLYFKWCNYVTSYAALLTSCQKSQQTNCMRFFTYKFDTNTLTNKFTIPIFLRFVYFSLKLAKQAICTFCSETECDSL